MCLASGSLAAYFHHACASHLRDALGAKTTEACCCIASDTCWCLASPSLAACIHHAGASPSRDSPIAQSTEGCGYIASDIRWCLAGMALPMPAACVHEKSAFWGDAVEHLRVRGQWFFGRPVVHQTIRCGLQWVFPISGLPSLHIFRRGGPRTPLRLAWLSGVSLGYNCIRLTPHIYIIYYIVNLW